MTFFFDFIEKMVRSLKKDNYENKPRVQLNITRRRFAVVFFRIHLLGLIIAGISDQFLDNYSL